MKVCLAVLAARAGRHPLFDARQPSRSFGLRMLAGAAGRRGRTHVARADRRPGRDGEAARLRSAAFSWRSSSASLPARRLSGLLADFVGWRGVFALSSGLALIALRGGAVRFPGTAAPAARFRSLGGARPLPHDRRRSARARALFCLRVRRGVAIFGLFPYLAPLLESRGEAARPRPGWSSRRSRSAASSIPPWWLVLLRPRAGAC